MHVGHQRVYILIDGIADSSVIICVSLSTKVEGKLDRDGLTYLLSLTGKKISWPFCWNSIPNSNSRKRKISSSLNPEPQTSKRPAYSALPLDFPLDHQRSRSSNNNHLSSKDKDFNSSQSNKTIKSNLLDRITSTSQALYTSHKKRIVSLHLTFVRFTLNERHLSIPVSTSDHHERQDQLTKKFFMNINTSYSHTLDSIAKQITLPLDHVLTMKFNLSSLILSLFGQQRKQSSILVLLLEPTSVARLVDDVHVHHFD
ncbi:hypothetical protein PSTG_06938 [Puccinia striiformis f. sp. tritici PST-78]|uniref:Uncharacterized protein n=1 Tax=Puccinia striiformis f. sp. tritici PST-78 TaxID=1165861 RepID=A0A0L0VLG3_9BASI|nr:hypothetical protein PSTG_06938 [Puccinia striiformis f. sp. tritici PST-78]